MKAVCSIFKLVAVRAAFLWCLLHPTFCFGAGTGSLADEPLVDLKTFAPTILIDLRYATNRNFTHRKIYPDGTLCLVRRGVAERLRFAQSILKQRGYGLKVWDAYRTPEAQRALFNFAKNRHFVADPERTALHTWGVAVDATLVDAKGREVPMPTDFDEFSDASSIHYVGTNALIAQNLRMLQGAMGSAGFYGVRTEWWHFTAKNWNDYGPIKPDLKP
jgi:D-alanyl-D-alanine dipeptidase